MLSLTNFMGIDQNYPRRTDWVRPPLLRVPAGEPALGRFSRPERQQSANPRYPSNRGDRLLTGPKR
jgi:hypothetical protein